MRKILITTALALGFSLMGGPSFAGGYVSADRTAASASVQLRAADEAQAGSPADHTSASPSNRTETSGNKCWYVLDVLLCD